MGTFEIVINPGGLGPAPCRPSARRPTASSPGHEGSKRYWYENKQVPTPVVISPGGIETRRRPSTAQARSRSLSALEVRNCHAHASRVAAVVFVISPGRFKTGRPRCPAPPSSSGRRPRRVRNVLNLSGSAGPSRSSSAQEGSQPPNLDAAALRGPRRHQPKRVRNAQAGHWWRPRLYPGCHQPRWDRNGLRAGMRLRPPRSLSLGSTVRRYDEARSGLWMAEDLPMSLTAYHWRSHSAPCVA